MVGGVETENKTEGKQNSDSLLLGSPGEKERGWGETPGRSNLKED